MAGIPASLAHYPRCEGLHHVNVDQREPTNCGELPDRHCDEEGYRIGGR
jgi:hypothetical protein